ncbi:MAG: glycogen debranching protein [Candidatus Campbellbacteria bacterium]|nr:glycogen debranching protein [Candidatus Campbellbacteria bacterium]
MSIAEETQKEAVKLLREISTAKGFVATTEEHDNYYRVWGRDGVICALGALMSEEEDLIDTSKKTLETLSEFQDHTGRIVSNVSLNGEKISYGTTVGRVDATLWYVIGMMRFTEATGDNYFFDTYKENIEKALFYLECLELNGRGLIYVPQGGDWADEYLHEGYVLFDQLLYLIALTLFAKRTGDEYYTEKASKLREIIKVNYTPTEENKDSDMVYHKSLYQKMVESYVPPLPIASFNPHRTYHHKDVFAVSLFMMLELADKEACRDIIDSIGVEFVNSDFPIVPAFYPVIHEDEPDWKKLEANYLFHFKNKPFEFHNGGRWPMVHGFYIAGGNHDLHSEVERFAQILARDNFRFPEFYHGRDCTSMGVSRLGMSAAGYLIAYHSAIENKKPFGRII